MPGMAGQLEQILEEMRTRLQAELDEQLRSASTHEAEAVARGRHEAEIEADRRWASKLDAVKFEWSSRLQTEIAAARAEAEKRLVAETLRIRREADETVASERERAAADRTRLERASTPMRATDAGPVLPGIRSIDEARSLSEALTALVHAAAEHAPRAALFILNGQRFDEWRVDGVERLSHQPVDLEHGGLLRAAVRRGNRVSAPQDAGAPSFALLPDGRGACAVPLAIEGEPVAVLYGDEGLAGEAGRLGWNEALDLLARHTAACLARLTVLRALQLLQGHAQPAPGLARSDETQSARRYAKLLVSEIKLYNEGAVRVGRERRDLLHRLHAEIERARRLYEERVPETVLARGAYFQEELIQTLAGGDPALLGA